MTACDGTWIRIKLPVLIIFCLFGWRAQAQHPSALPDYIGAHAMGTGGSGRAAILQASSHFLNPAAVAHFSAFSATLGYQRDSSQLPSQQGDAYAVQVSDASPDTLFAGSFSAVQRDWQKGESSVAKVQDFQLNFAGIVWSNLAFGIAAHRVQITPRATPRNIQHNGHIGLLYNWSSVLGVGLVGYDLLPPDNSTPEEFRTSRRYGAGINYNVSDEVRFRLDAEMYEANNPNRKLTYFAGFENSFIKDVFLRLGYTQDDRLEEKYYTTGVGWDGPRVRVNYALRVADGRGIDRHVFDLTMPF